MLLRRYHEKETEEEIAEKEMQAMEEIYEDNQHDIINEGESLNDLKVKELRELAKETGLEGYSNLNKNDLIELLAGAE